MNKRTKLISLRGFIITEVKLNERTCKIEVYGKSSMKAPSKLLMISSASSTFDCDGNWFEEFYN